MLFSIRTTGFHFSGFRNKILYTARSSHPCVLPPTWRTRSLYLCPPATVERSYNPRHQAPFRRVLRLAGLRRRYSNPAPHGKIENTSQPKATNYVTDTVLQYLLLQIVKILVWILILQFWQTQRRATVDCNIKVDRRWVGLWGEIDSSESEKEPGVEWTRWRKF
jgi:hypothetical protein